MTTAKKSTLSLQDIWNYHLSSIPEFLHPVMERSGFIVICSFSNPTAVETSKAYTINVRNGFATQSKRNNSWQFFKTQCFHIIKLVDGKATLQRINHPEQIYGTQEFYDENSKLNLTFELGSKILKRMGHENYSQMWFDYEDSANTFVKMQQLQLLVCKTTDCDFTIVPLPKLNQSKPNSKYRYVDYSLTSNDIYNCEFIDSKNNLFLQNAERNFEFAAPQGITVSEKMVRPKFVLPKVNHTTLLNSTLATTYNNSSEIVELEL